MCQKRGIWGPRRVETQFNLYSEGLPVSSQGGQLVLAAEQEEPGREEVARPVARTVGSGQAALSLKTGTALKCCVAWGKLLNLTKAQFLLQSGDENEIVLILNSAVMMIDIMHITDLAVGWAYSVSC